MATKQDAGIELDALIAEQVMGWRRIDEENFDGGEAIPFGLKVKDWEEDRIAFNPSTSMEAGWRVVEHLVSKQYCPFILREDRYNGTFSGGIWLCSFGIAGEVYEQGPMSGDGEADYYWDHDPQISASDSAPHAICLAALRAVTKEIPHGD